MNIIAAGEIKRRGISAVDKLAEDGPVHVVKESRVQYVVMSESDYQQMINDLADARLAAAEADGAAKRVRRGSAAQLMREIRKGE
jgi:PHD/YefM family antitoxin component YafN of YafNO toxin-antitoxin module